MEYLKVAKIIDVVGLKGELKVYTTSSFKNIRYKKGNTLLIELDNDNHQSFTIESYRNKEGNIDVIKFKEINSIDEAKKYINKEILTIKSEKDLKKDQYFYSDLVGLKCFNESNKELGVVNEVSEFSLNLSLKVKTSDNKFVYVPFNDYFIKEISLDKKYIIINEIEGLFE